MQTDFKSFYPKLRDILIFTQRFNQYRLSNIRKMMHLDSKL